MKRNKSDRHLKYGVHANPRPRTRKSKKAKDLVPGDVFFGEGTLSCVKCTVAFLHGPGLDWESQWIYLVNFRDEKKRNGCYAFYADDIIHLV